MFIYRSLKVKKSVNKVNLMYECRVVSGITKTNDLSYIAKNATTNCEYITLSNGMSALV